MHNQTPLTNAIMTRQTAAVRTLIAAGAEVNPGNNKWASPLMCSVLDGNKEIIELLLEKGADRDFRNSEGKTAYDWALANGRMEFAELVKPSKRLLDPIPAPLVAR